MARRFLLRNETTFDPTQDGLKFQIIIIVMMMIMIMIIVLLYRRFVI